VTRARADDRAEAEAAVRVDVVIAGDGAAAQRAAAAAAEAGARVRVLDAGAVTALLRPADAVHGVCHRAPDGAEATVEAPAVVLALDGESAVGLLAAAASAGADHAPEGLRVDAEARVLDRHGLSIPGLYAATATASAADAGKRAAARAAATRSRERDG
jgi:predicted oxidoreductase